MKRVATIAAITVLFGALLGGGLLVTQSSEAPVTEPAPVEVTCDLTGALERSEGWQRISAEDERCLERAAVQPGAPFAVEASRALIRAAEAIQNRELRVYRIERHIALHEESIAALAFQLALHTYGEGRFDESQAWIDLAIKHHDELDPKLQPLRLEVFADMRAWMTRPPRPEPQPQPHPKVVASVEERCPEVFKCLEAIDAQSELTLDWYIQSCDLGIAIIADLIVSHEENDPAFQTPAACDW